MLDGPVFDTLTAVNHPDLRTGAWIWSRRISTRACRHIRTSIGSSPGTTRPGQGTPGRCCSTAASAGFARDPALGRAVIELAHATRRRSRSTWPPRASGPAAHQVFLRLFWTDAQRLEYFAVLGFVIDPAQLRAAVVRRPRSDGFEALLTAPRRRRRRCNSGHRRAWRTRLRHAGRRTCTAARRAVPDVVLPGRRHSVAAGRRRCAPDLDDRGDRAGARPAPSPASARATGPRRCRSC